MSAPKVDDFRKKLKEAFLGATMAPKPKEAKAEEPVDVDDPEYEKKKKAQGGY